MFQDPIVSLETEYISSGAQKITENRNVYDKWNWGEEFEL